MQALEWAASFSHKVHSVIPCLVLQTSAQNIAFHEIGRQAIMADLIGKKAHTMIKKYRKEVCL